MSKTRAFKHSIKGKRNKNDFYPTHHSMVWQLMEILHIPENYKIHDPACGNNDILKALQECGINNYLTGKDISKGDDFLIDDNYYDVIFTNPPFSIANIFIEKAFRIANDAVIMLLPLDYLHGTDRYQTFYKEQNIFYLSQVYVFVRRPMFTDSVRPDGCYNTGSVTFAWFVWTRILEATPDPIIKWIDNNKYVIGSKKEIDIKQGVLF